MPKARDGDGKAREYSDPICRRKIFTGNSLQPIMSACVCFCISILTCAAIGGITGCTTQKNPQGYLKKESEYSRILTEQKQKDTKAIEKEISKKIPEMTAEEYENLGDTYNGQNNIEKAFIYYNKALNLDPERTGLRYKVGILFIQRGMIDEAMTGFEEILKKDPKSVHAYEGKGMVLLASDKLDEAKRNFRKAISLDPKLWRAHTFLGIIYDHQGMYEAAIGEYRKAININPHSSALFNNLGMSYYLKGDYKRASETLNKALKMGPENPKIYNNLGMTLCKLEKYEDALVAFKKGGNTPGAYNNIGYFYMVEKKYEKALESFEKAIEMKPQYYTKAQENRDIARSALSEYQKDLPQKKSDAKDR